MSRQLAVPDVRIRSPNSENSLVKAASRLELAGRLGLKATNRVPVLDIYFQNKNWIPAADGQPGRWKLTEAELNLQELNREDFRAYAQGVFNLFGKRKFRNATEPEGHHRLLAYKLVRAWDGWTPSVRKRLWDSDSVRHGACINSIHQFLRIESERNKHSKHIVQFQNLDPFMVNAIVTIVSFLPEEWNLTDEQMKILQPVRGVVGGRLQARVYETTFSVPGFLTLESLLEVFAAHQKKWSTFGRNRPRQPKYLQLFQSSDPADSARIPCNPATFDVVNDYDFHNLTANYGPALLGANTGKGIWFHAVMHPFVADSDTTNNVVRGAAANHPLLRYANHRTYKCRTWPMSRPFKPDLDAETWVRNGNPDKRRLANGKLEIPLPVHQEASEDDDSEDEAQHQRFVNRTTRRVDAQTALFREAYIRAKGEDVYFRDLGKMHNPDVEGNAELRVLGQQIDVDQQAAMARRV